MMWLINLRINHDLNCLG